MKESEPQKKLEATAQRLTIPPPRKPFKVALAGLVVLMMLGATVPISFYSTEIPVCNYTEAPVTERFSVINGDWERFFAEKPHGSSDGICASDALHYRKARLYLL